MFAYLFEYKYQIKERLNVRKLILKKNIPHRASLFEMSVDVFIDMFILFINCELGIYESLLTKLYEFKAQIHQLLTRTCNYMNQNWEINCYLKFKLRRFILCCML